MTEDEEWNYYGDFVEGKLDGFGKKSSKSGELIWEGSWIKGQEYTGRIFLKIIFIKFLFFSFFSS